MRINDVYVPLQEDIHISSVLRIAKSVVLKPQAAQICLTKYKSALDVSPNEVLSVSKIDQSFVNENPGLSSNETLATATAKNSIPVLLTNATNKTYKSIEFQTREINEIDVYNLEVDVPEEHKVRVEQLIKINKDLFAERDLDLSHTDTVTMKIDTGNCEPINLKPYRTPLNKRQIVDKAIDDMLSAKIIRRCNLLWSFPIVVVDKKGGFK